MEQNRDCAGYIHITIETGPEFTPTPRVERALAQIAASVAEIEEEFTDEVGGFAFGDPFRDQSVVIPMRDRDEMWIKRLARGGTITVDCGCNCINHVPTE